MFRGSWCATATSMGRHLARDRCRWRSRRAARFRFGCVVDRSVAPGSGSGRLRSLRWNLRAPRGTHRGWRGLLALGLLPRLGRDRACGAKVCVQRASFITHQDLGLGGWSWRLVRHHWRAAVDHSPLSVGPARSPGDAGLLGRIIRSGPRNTEGAELTAVDFARSPLRPLRRGDDIPWAPSAIVEPLVVTLRRYFDHLGELCLAALVLWADVAAGGVLRSYLGLDAVCEREPSRPHRPARPDQRVCFPADLSALDARRVTGCERPP